MTAAGAQIAARRTGRYYYIAATAFVLFFLTAYIPRFSATALSLRSQTARAERLAGQTGLLDESGRLDLSRIDERDTAQLKRYRELYASLDNHAGHETQQQTDPNAEAQMEQMSVEEMNLMVEEVNEREVDSIDVLSNHVYQYKRELEEIIY